jgi:murein DD-endopeptidase MepM/ murein hydrolase activator NlpD
MPNLANVQPKAQAQDRITNNRDAILPTKRFDEAPSIQIVANQRDAFRGSPVEETRRALGLVNDGAEAILGINTNMDAIRAPGERAKGSTDAAAGSPADPQLAHSLAYQSAYYGAKAEATLTQQSADIEQNVQDIIDKGGTPSDVHEYVTKRVHDIVASAPHDFPSPTAQHELGVGLMKFTAELEAKTQATFKVHADNELVSNEGFNLTNRLTTGEGITTSPLEPAGQKAQSSETAAPKYAPPVAGKVTSRYGDARDNGKSHDGVDYAAPIGTPVGAAAAGTVIATGHDSQSGNFVKVQHQDGSVTSYAHLGSVSANQGQSVDAGTQLGTVGTTGHTTGPHVHFVYRDPQGHLADPEQIIGQPAPGVNLPVPQLAKRSTLQQDISAQFEASMATLQTAGIDPKKAKQGLIDSITRWGTNPADPHPEELLAFANATQKDGKTPSLNPEERAKIQDASVTAIGYAERLKTKARKDAQDILEPQLYTALSKGEDASPTIDQAVKNGVFTPEEGLAWRSRFRTELDRTEKGEANYAVANGFQLELTQSGVDVEDIRRRATDAYNSGEFGTGKAASQAYTAVMKQASTRRAPKASNQPDAQAARGYVNDVLRPDRLDLAGNKGVSFAYRSAQQAWEQKVDSGTDPMKAAEETITEWQPKIDAAVKAPIQKPPAPIKPGQRPAVTPPPADNAAAVARINELARQRAEKMRQLQQR